MFKSLIDYLYTGHLSLDSSDLLEMLELCQEYLLYDLKQLLEQLIIKNIDFDNFSETMNIARAYECRVLKEALYQFGQKNYQILYSKGGFKTLHKDEWAIIKEGAKV